MFIGVLAMVLVLASCSRTESGKAGPATIGPLAGWQLTLPVPGPKGDAQIVNPAVVSPPWLTTDPTGALARGVTTKNAGHTRTTLDHLDAFAAGSGARTLTASVTVTQLPTAGPEVIVGQIHGAKTTGWTSAPCRS